MQGPPIQKVLGLSREEEAACRASTGAASMRAGTRALSNGPGGCWRSIGRGIQLAGKVVVDISNPLDFETFDSLTVPADSSATAQIAAALPRSRVVKAFNTTFAATLAGGTVGDVPTTVLIAGDDAEAKSLLAGIVVSAGLRAIDAGSQRRARELEGLGFPQISLTAAEKVAWTGGLAVVS